MSPGVEILATAVGLVVVVIQIWTIRWAGRKKEETPEEAEEDTDTTAAPAADAAEDGDDSVRPAEAEP